ncbi:MAG: alpha/beta hydrolase [Halieaceae bacterium]|nr:alpha/beta hydrolase [Halieaceae bacterium]
MASFDDFYYPGHDGLKLYARDYRHSSPRATILCMHGLTRNSADFAGIADHLAKDYRLLVVEQRGRGLSEWDSNAANYQPAVYVQDMFALLDQLGLDRVVLLGTSLGGLMSMIMAAMQPQRLRAVIMNDIGPVVNPEGLERIKDYVGKSGPVGSWGEAVAQQKAINGKEFPDFSEQQWLDFCHALYRENDEGIPVLAYDPAISQPMTEDQDAAVPPDLWPAFDALKPIPTLVIRGVLSDILAEDCVAEMQSRKPDLSVAQIPNRGHAPILDEPDSIAAIDRFLEEALS